MFDRKRLVDDFERVAAERGMTEGDACTAAGIGPTLLTKMRRVNAGPNAENLLRMCRWANLSPLDYLS